MDLRSLTTLLTPLLGGGLEYQGITDVCLRDPPPTHTSWLLLQKEEGSQGPRLTLRASAVGPAGRQLCWLLGVTNDLFISVWTGASPPLKGGFLCASYQTCFFSSRNFLLKHKPWCLLWT